MALGLGGPVMMSEQVQRIVSQKVDEEILTASQDVLKKIELKRLGNRRIKNLSNMRRRVSLERSSMQEPSKELNESHAVSL